MIPISITATTDLEIAALKTIIFIAEGEWFDDFPEWVERHLWQINPEMKDKEFDLDGLSDLMIKWSKELDTMIEFSKKVEC